MARCIGSFAKAPPVCIDGSGLSKAVVYLNEALKLDPIGMSEAHLRLAALYNGAGLKDRTATEYEKFPEKRPDYPEVRGWNNTLRPTRNSPIKPLQ